MLVIGFASGTDPVTAGQFTALKGAAVIGVFWGSFAQRQPQDNVANFRAAVCLVCRRQAETFGLTNLCARRYSTSDQYPGCT